MAFDNGPDDDQVISGEDGDVKVSRTAPPSDWKQTDVRHISPGVQAQEDPLAFWRAHHNDPAYRELADRHAQQQARIEEIRAKAQFDAQNFEKRYTEKQKADIAKWNKAQIDIDNNPNYSDDEKRQIKSKIDLMKLGIKPSDLPKLSPYPKGQGVGDVWTDKGTGAVVTMRKPGETHVLVRPDQTAAYKAGEAKYKMDNDHLKNTAKHQSEMMKLREKFAIEESEGTGINAGKKTKRVRSADEIDKIMRGISGEKEPEGQQTTNAPGSSQMGESGNASGTYSNMQGGGKIISSRPGPEKVTTNEDYERIPKGAQYISPDGKLRTKQ
jgi:hypothetical protein